MVVECRALSLGTFGDLNKLLQLGHQSEPPAVKAVRTQKLAALIVLLLDMLFLLRACATYARARQHKILTSHRLEAIGRNTPSTFTCTTVPACRIGGISRRVALPDSFSK